MASSAALKIPTILDNAYVAVQPSMTVTILVAAAPQIQDIQIIVSAQEQTWITQTTLVIAASKTQQTLDNASVMLQIILMTQIKVRLLRIENQKNFNYFCQKWKVCTYLSDLYTNFES